MDSSIFNSLIYDYLSKKDKVLAETVKTKLKAVSIIWSSDELSCNFKENEKTYSRAHFSYETHFQNCSVFQHVGLVQALKHVYKCRTNQLLFFSSIATDS